MPTTVRDISILTTVCCATVLSVCCHDKWLFQVLIANIRFFLVVRLAFPLLPSVKTWISNKKICNGHSMFTRAYYDTLMFEFLYRLVIRLSNGCLLLLCGRLADIIGSKRMFLIGSVWFSVWSIAAAFATNPHNFIIFLGMLGIGSGSSHSII
jgi:MFS family permease